MRSSRLHDLAALLARTAVGVVFVAHGWLKIEDGITATAAEFDRMGVPLAKAAAVYATFAELLGGAALIVGLGLPVVGIALFLDMAGAFAFVHVDRGLSAPEGFELVIVLGLASLLFAAGGGGDLTVDRALRVQRSRKEELAEFLPPDDAPHDAGPFAPARRLPPPPAEPYADEAAPAGPREPAGPPAPVEPVEPVEAARTTEPDLPLPAAPDPLPAAPDPLPAAPGDVAVARARRRRGTQGKDAK